MWQSQSHVMQTTGYLEWIISLMKRLLIFPKSSINYDTKVVYKCQTCQLDGAQGLCYLCAQSYHHSHDLVYIDTNFTCCFHCTYSRMTGERVLSNQARTSIENKFKTVRTPVNSVCTFTNTEKNFVLQSEYRCGTCQLDGDFGMCCVCATRCHKGHDVYYVRYGSFSCDCGAQGTPSCKALGKPNLTQEKTETNEKKDVTMYSAFECPVCMSYMCAPIHICERGHSVCSTCITKITECPLCRGEFSIGRNLSMEALGQVLQIPCEDCEVEYVVAAMNSHKKMCPMKDYTCPLEPFCSWTGKFWNIYGHCKQHHKDKVLNGSNHVFVLMDCTTKDDKQVKMINKDGVMFLFHSRYDKEQQVFQAVVKFLDPYEEDCAFSYSLQFTSPNSEESVVFKKIVRPGYENVEDNYKQNECVTLTMVRTSSFIVMDLLVYKLSLTKMRKNVLSS